MEFNSLDASARLLGRLFPERLYIPAGETPEMEEASMLTSEGHQSPLNRLAGGGDPSCTGTATPSTCRRARSGLPPPRSTRIRPSREVTPLWRCSFTRRSRRPVSSDGSWDMPASSRRRAIFPSSGSGRTHGAMRPSSCARDGSFSPDGSTPLFFRATGSKTHSLLVNRDIVIFCRRTAGRSDLRRGMEEQW